MKRRFQWFIVFLTLFGLAVPSFLIYSDVNAKQYTISTLPLTVPGVSYSSDNIVQTSAPYSFYFVTSDDYNDSQLYRNWVFNASSSDNNDSCIGRSFAKFPIITSLSNSRTSFNYSYRGFDNNWTAPFSIESCSYIEPTLPIQNSSLGNIVPVEELDDILDMPPYRVHSSGIYRTDHMSDNGLDYDTKFNLLFDVFGDSDNYPSKIYSLTVPFGPSPVPLDNGTLIEFSGEYWFSFDNPNGGVDHVDFTLDITYLTQQNSSSTRHAICTSTLAPDDPDDPYSVYGLKYSCPYTLGSDFASYDPSTTFVYFTLSSTWTYDDNVPNIKLDNLVFDSAISVTDNDYTPGGEWGVPIIGSKPDSSLGSASRNPLGGPNSEPNFFSSLIGLFNFDFINPFTPLFGLFANNESCTQIPTIAGMIHSEEQTVCPWFDSSTRNIVTPVLGISSMMLLFGFAVRWLGARSGNFFGDDLDADNIDNWHGFHNNGNIGVGKFRRKH